LGKNFKTDLEALPRQPYFVWFDDSAPLESYFCDVERDDMFNSSYRHVFCGPNEISGAWCPNCNKPLLKLLDLDTSDPRLELGSGTPLRLPLLYCWTCNICEIAKSAYFAGVGDMDIDWFVSPSYLDLTMLVRLPANEKTHGLPFMYKLFESGSVELIQYGKGGCTGMFPYGGDYPLSFPGVRASLYKISDEVAEAIYAENRQDESMEYIFRDHNELSETRHQVGGEPLLIQKDIDLTMVCPSCGKLMPRFASIGDDNLDPRGFVGDKWTQVIYHFCKQCQIVGCFNQAD